MKILLGVSASIAIYKSCEIVRLLKKNGINVTIIMTPTASGWISPVVFSALSENRVYVYDTDHNEAMAHINLRNDKDLFLIAPASANVISQAANGMSQTLLSTLLLSFPGPRWIAPAMNPVMYNHPAVQRNLLMLKDYHYRILSPDTGESLCGDTGEGKMAAVDYIVSQVLELKKNG